MPTVPQLLVLAIFAVSQIAHAQKIDPDPVATIQAYSPTEIDSHMSAMAQAISVSAPIQADAVTTVVRAIYVKPSRMLVYMVQLSAPISPADAAQSMKSGFCAGRTNLALIAKGVTYQYAVTTPTQTYNITFTKGSC